MYAIHKTQIDERPRNIAKGKPNHSSKEPPREYARHASATMHTTDKVCTIIVAYASGKTGRPEILLMYRLHLAHWTTLKSLTKLRPSHHGPLVCNISVEPHFEHVVMIATHTSSTKMLVGVSNQNERSKDTHTDHGRTCVEMLRTNPCPLPH